ncbi:MAG: hypothetical protein ACIARR_08585 [Phycisphaerales bacterium JB059]
MRWRDRLLVLLGRTRIRDARGRSRSCRKIVGASDIRGRYRPSRVSSLPPDDPAMGQIRESILYSAQLRRASALTNLGSVAFALALVLPFVLGLLVHPRWFWLWGVLLSLLTFFVVLWLIPRLERLYERAHVNAATSLSRCAWCFYPLDEIPPEDDARVVCPECGGAWNRAPGVPNN